MRARGGVDPQATADDRANVLAWLPDPPPSNFRVVVTATRECECVDGDRGLRLRRHGIHIVHAQPLGDVERAELIQGVARRMAGDTCDSIAV
jgi:hypothetical protein